MEVERDATGAGPENTKFTRDSWARRPSSGARGEVGQARVQTAPFPRGLDLDLAFLDFHHKEQDPTPVFHQQVQDIDARTLSCQNTSSQLNESPQLPSPKSNFPPWGSTEKTRSCTTFHVVTQTTEHARLSRSHQLRKKTHAFGLARQTAKTYRFPVTQASIPTADRRPRVSKRGRGQTLWFLERQMRYHHLPPPPHKVKQNEPNFFFFKVVNCQILFVLVY